MQPYDPRGQTGIGWRGRGADLAQWGPDPVSGKMKVYLAHFTEDARDLLVGLYGAAVVVSTESVQWRFTGLPDDSQGSCHICARTDVFRRLLTGTRELAANGVSWATAGHRRPRNDLVMNRSSARFR